jgi:hypothetical protein
VELGGSLPYLQELANGPFPELVASSPHLLTLFPFGSTFLVKGIVMSFVSEGEYEIWKLDDLNSSQIIFSYIKELNDMLGIALE